MKGHLKIKNVRKINVENLNQRQKKIYNFQKVSSLFAEYGFATCQYYDSWYNFDFVAYHIDGITCVNILLKNRLTFHKKYLHKEVYICFPNKENWYLYPHDELLSLFLDNKYFRNRRFQILV